MQFTTYIQKPTIRKRLNKLFRIASRTEVTQLGTNTLTVRNVYKNKQIIEVVGSFGRFNSKI